MHNIIQFRDLFRYDPESNGIRNALLICKIDMEKVLTIVQGFFDKYSNGDIDDEFPKEFEKICIAIERRIKNEEKILYAEYDWMDQ